ncbi:sulfite exporter TauE/SafE family protein [Caldovatus aquaticus]|uniref:Probable membrane transporter protein n=1 Tax=Caldovatus aquaticus TaxID=2865671 RepID=A0ABS7F5J9_9PROT|nr:sulfite exporter TauE/SafE family protein [Caldovatus aquaticus]MBW8270839.1 sulfite exporter TauE/SafE family protein [Caldovatus aquaticus]
MVESLLAFAAVGFLAQTVDGAIGMAYGLSAASVLLSLGVAPAVASASVHAAEVFTSGASGLSHWLLGHVRRDLVLRLAVPGALGGILGAYALVGLPIGAVRIGVSLYLLGMGGLILYRAFRPRSPAMMRPRRQILLGFCGGLLDAMGGGGWGPIVTSVLIGHGSAPRIAIGSASLAEFVVTVSVSATFLVTIGVSLWPVVTGLVLGGVVAAPFAAVLTRWLPERMLTAVVGVVVSLLALRLLLTALGGMAGGTG